MYERNYSLQNAHANKVNGILFEENYIIQDMILFLYEYLSKPVTLGKKQKEYEDDMYFHGVFVHVGVPHLIPFFSVFPFFMHPKYFFCVKMYRVSGDFVTIYICCFK